MSRLDDFFARLDDQTYEGVVDAELSDDGKVPADVMWAERAGVDYDDLTRLIEERVTLAINVLSVKVVDENMPIGVAMRFLACSIAREFFHAGGLWEQERNLPSLDLDPPDMDV